MKLNFSLLVLLFLVCFSHIEARHKLKGGKSHQRSKRTIGDIINWKLNLLQSIFGGIFGGGKKQPSAKPSYGPPKPSYGAPRPQRPAQKPRPSYNAPSPQRPNYNAPSPQRPSYNAPSPQSPQRPSYNGATPQRPSYNGQQKPNYGGGRPTARPRPSANPRPNYNNGQSQSAPEPQQQFGPSSVFKMLPAPNLATAAPQTGSRPSGSNLGSPSLDTYGSPQSPQAADVSVQAALQTQDTYGSPQAPAVVGGEDSYGSPLGNPISTPDSYRSPKFVPLPLSTSNTYSAPAAPSTTQSFSPASSASDSYGGVISPVINDNSAAPVIDSYGTVVSSPIIQDNSIAAPASDSYGGALSPVITQLSDPAASSDSYGGVIAPVVVQTSDPAPASDSYGGALTPVITEVSNPAPIQGGAIAPVIVQASEPAPSSDAYDGAISPRIPNPAPFQAALTTDLDTGVIAPAIVQADVPSVKQITEVPPQAEQDSYGTPQSNVLLPQADLDDYDPSDVPADQAAPQPSYTPDVDDYDPNDIPADQAANSNSDTLDSYGEAQSPILQPIITDNAVDTGSPQTFDVYGSALAPVGTSAPVPEEIFTVDSKAPTSFDSYNPQSIDDSLSQSVINDNSEPDVIDLTEPQTDTPQFAPAIEQLPDLTVNDIDTITENVTPVTIQEVVNDVIDDSGIDAVDIVEDSGIEVVNIVEDPGIEVVNIVEDSGIEDVNIVEDSVVDSYGVAEGAALSTPEETPTASLLPPVVQDVIDLKSGVEQFSDDAVEAVTPTSAPVLFTYAPVEGPTFDDLQPQINIVVQNDDEGSSLSDPLNVIPDEYEELNYDSDYDANDVPADQAEPLDSYANEDALDSYGNNDISSLNENTFQEIDGPAPSPAFEDLRGIEFTTGALRALNDPQPTTYRSPIDFDFGTTAADGIEVGNVVTSIEEAPDYFDNSLSGADEIEELSQPLYEDQYEEENETDYSPKNQNIPIVIQESVTEGPEALPSYDPVVLLVGTPEKKDDGASQAADLPLYENSLEAKSPRKRKANGKKNNTLKQRYNNWFGPRNDWSRRIQRVQGRIRYKKQNQENS